MKDKWIYSVAGLAFTLAIPLASTRAEETVDFNAQIKPILEFNCVRCHAATEKEKPKGGLRLDNKAGAFKGGENGVVIVPGDPAKSPLHTSTILPKDDEKVMPPKGDLLTKAQTDLLKLWIEQGAKWPDEVTLIARKLEAKPAGDDAAMVAEIHRRILAGGIPASAAEMKGYNEVISGCQVSFDLGPIPGGTFTMGSPATEP
ncbi:MAG: hypothetical protein JWR69_3735, partial [Pedosphaera sp.]|nr:hypothetical protein [Pedosphaera sp.]